MATRRVRVSKVARQSMRRAVKHAKAAAAAARQAAAAARAAAQSGGAGYAGPPIKRR